MTSPPPASALEAQGVQFVTETFDSGVCHQAIFLDPAGNSLDLHHRYAPGGGLSKRARGARLRLLSALRRADAREDRRARAIDVG